MAKDGDRQRGRSCTEQFVKGVGWRPVCRECDTPMEKLESFDMYRNDYKCECGGKWTEEQIH